MKAIPNVRFKSLNADSSSYVGDLKQNHSLAVADCVIGCERVQNEG